MKMQVDYVQHFRDRHGRPRTYFRKKGCKRVPLPHPWQPEFHGALATALADAAPIVPGEKRSVHGTVDHLVGAWFASPDFTTRPESVRHKHRIYGEAFRREHGDKRIAKLEIDHLERIYAAMADRPAAANQWRVAIKDLLKYAVRKKMIAVNPAADLKKMAPKRPDGHHTWTPSEVEGFRRKHAIGTKARLTLELMLALALRRSDATRLGPAHVRNGVLSYVQFKNRNRKPIEVTVEMPPALARVIAATPGTGIKTWLLDATGKQFNDDSFADWFAAKIEAAGLPRECTTHGLRKRALADLANAGCTTKEIMAISGHTTLKEVERYTTAADRKRLAGKAMNKRATSNA
jgi:integrase